MVFDMDDIMRLPSVSRMCFIECGANTAMEWNNTAVPTVQYTPLVAREKPELKAPYLEGISIGGDLRIIYSPYDLHAGWSGCEHPMMRGLQPASATAIGLDLIVYAVTH